MNLGNRFWKGFWIAAALFNFGIGIPISLRASWAFDVAFTAAAGRDPTAIQLWRDFGILVVLIGVGYWIVAVDVARNRGIVWLGILAKLFDVVTLTLRWATGLSNPIVLLPAAIDGGFTVLFVVFLLRKPDGGS